MTDVPVGNQGRELDELLSAYALVRRQASSLPAIVWPRLGAGRLTVRIRVPLTRAFLSTLLTHRLRRSVDAISRHEHERAALGVHPDVRERELRSLDHFGASLPPVPYRRLTIAFLLGALLIAYGLSHGAFRSEADARGIARALDGVLTLDPNAATDAVRSFELRGALGAFFTLALAVLVVSVPLAASFRLERMLLNRYPAGADNIGQESVAEHATRTDGIYDLERRTFAALDAKPPKEFAIDLAVRAMALLLPIWAALILAAIALFGLSDVETSPWLFGIAAAALALLTADAYRTTLHMARSRRTAPSDVGAPRRGRWSARLAVAAIVVAGIAGGVALPAVSTGDPVPVSLVLKQAIVQPGVTQRQYLSRLGVPSAGLTAEQLAARGYTVSYRAAATALDDAVSVEYVLFDVAGKRVSSTRGLILRPGETASIEKTGGTDPRELILLHVSGARRSENDTPTYVEQQQYFWAPLPRRPGRFYGELRATDRSGTPLAVIRTLPFEVTATAATSAAGTGEEPPRRVPS